MRKLRIVLFITGGLAALGYFLAVVGVGPELASEVWRA